MTEVDAPSPTLADAMIAARTAAAVGDLPRAEALCRGLIAQAPQLPEPYELLGRLALDAGRPAAARALFVACIARAAGWLDAYIGLARAAAAADDYPGAMAAWRNALTLEPARAELWTDLAVNAHHAADFAAAARFAEHALALQPQDSQALLARAHCRLLAGDWAAGWEDYEGRWLDDQTAGYAAPSCPRLLSVAAAQGARVIVLAEQGFGDTLQGLRFVDWLAGVGATVTLAVPAPLHRLVAGMGYDVVANHPPFPPADYWVPTLDLARLSRARPDNLAGRVPYLQADPAAVGRWRNRLPPGRPRVGLIWAGNPAYRRDRLRSPGLAAFAPVLAVPGVQFVALQMGARRDEMTAVALPPNFVDLGGQVGDFADTAAIMSGLDLVISSCTGPAHLAGALGVPLWLLLPRVPDWRWMLDRADTPWYPQARLYRQDDAGWTPVMRRLAGDLAAYASMTASGGRGG